MFIKIDCHTFADRMAEDFSRDAAEALFYWLEELEAGGEEQEFDRVAIRCEFTEYPSATVAAQEYGWKPETDLYDASPDLDEEEIEQKIEEENEELALEWLQYRTSVVEFDGGVIIQNF